MPENAKNSMGDPKSRPSYNKWYPPRAAHQKTRRDAVGCWVRLASLASRADLLICLPLSLCLYSSPARGYQVPSRSGRSALTRSVSASGTKLRRLLIIHRRLQCHREGLLSQKEPEHSPRVSQPPKSCLALRSVAYCMYQWRRTERTTASATYARRIDRVTSTRYL